MKTRNWEKFNAPYDLAISRQMCQKNGGNVRKTKEVIPADVKTIIDVGSGRKEEDPRFIEYIDLDSGGDYHWLQHPDNSFDMVFASHALEHSPMPFFALTEWKRVTKKYILIVVPRLTHDDEWNDYLCNYKGHFSCFTKEGWRNLFSVAGLKIVKEIDADWWVHMGVPKPQTVFLLKK